MQDEWNPNPGFLLFVCFVFVIKVQQCVLYLEKHSSTQNSLVAKFQVGQTEVMIPGMSQGGQISNLILIFSKPLINAFPWTQDLDKKMCQFAYSVMYSFQVIIRQIKGLVLCYLLLYRGQILKNNPIFMRVSFFFSFKKYLVFKNYLKSYTMVCQLLLSLLTHPVQIQNSNDYF